MYTHQLVQLVGACTLTNLWVLVQSSNMLARCTMYTRQLTALVIPHKLTATLIGTKRKTCKSLDKVIYNADVSTHYLVK